MAIGKIETEAQLLDFIREELIGTMPQRLEQAIGMLGRIKTGQADAVFTASQAAAETTVAHGMGVAPDLVVANYDGSLASTALFVFPVTARSLTEFKIAGKCSVVASVTVTFRWFAVKFA